MVSHEVGELDKWLADMRLDGAHGNAHCAALADATEAFVAALMATPPSDYREKALCKATDAAVLGYIAART